VNYNITEESRAEERNKKKRLQCEKEPRNERVCVQFGTEDSFESLSIFSMIK